MDLLNGRVLALTAVMGLTVPFVTHASLSQDGEIIDPRAKMITEAARHLCSSTDEYIRTLTFLRESKEVVLPETTARLVAEKVSRGCEGAAERFQHVLLLLKGVGVSDPKSLELALRFSNAPPDVQRNFTVVFSRAFLNEFFDYDYTTALSLALALSKDYDGDPAQLRDDFIYLTDLCKDSKTIDLPIRVCAEYAVKVARLSAVYPQGIRAHFGDLYKKLREDRDFGMDIKTALDVTYKVLKHGPRAHDNFMNAYAFAMKDKGLALDRTQALAFALKMAARSHRGKTPPVIPAAPGGDASEVPDAVQR